MSEGTPKVEWEDSAFFKDNVFTCDPITNKYPGLSHYRMENKGDSSWTVTKHFRTIDGERSWRPRQDKKFRTRPEAEQWVTDSLTSELMECLAYERKMAKEEVDEEEE